VGDCQAETLSEGAPAAEEHPHKDEGGGGRNRLLLPLRPSPANLPATDDEALGLGRQLQYQSSARETSQGRMGLHESLGTPTFARPARYAQFDTA
jgi:hypothetical protein